MSRLLTVYWILCNLLAFTGGAIGWFQLKFHSDMPVSRYLALFLRVSAFCGLVFLIGTVRIHRALALTPVFVIFPFVVSTLLAQAVWSWLFYGAGYLNGDGWRGLLKRLFWSRRRHKMNNKRRERREDDEVRDESSKSKTPPAGKPGTRPGTAEGEEGGGPTPPTDPGVGSGPGRGGQP